MSLNSLGGISRGYLGTLKTALLALVALTFVGTSAHAQGVGTGTAAVNIGDALGIPGGTATVVVSLATENEEVAAAQVDIMFDTALLSIAPEDCVKDARLADQSLNVFLVGEASDTLRVAVSDQNPPIAQLTEGALATCSFQIADDAPLGDTDLVADRVVVGSREGLRICGPDEEVVCDSRDGVVSIGVATATPTATSTPSQPTATNTPTREATATVTPTGDGGTPTATPTGDGETPTATPTGDGATPTNTRPPTATSTPDGEGSPTPTATEDGGDGTPTATRTATGGPQGRNILDDSCAIVPTAQANPLRSWLLLVGPALLFWGRRRKL